MPKHGNFIWGKEWRDRGVLDASPHSFQEGLRRVGLLSPENASCRPIYRHTNLYVDVDKNSNLSGDDDSDDTQNMSTVSLKSVTIRANLRLRLRTIYRPLLTPGHLPAAYCQALTAQEAATIYSGTSWGLKIRWCHLILAFSSYARFAFDHRPKGNGSNRGTAAGTRDVQASHGLLRPSGLSLGQGQVSACRQQPVVCFW